MAITYSSINSLEEFSIVGGSDISLVFTVYDEDGLPVTLTGAVATLVIAPYGQPTNLIETITGVVTLPSQVTFILPYTLTGYMLTGKYMYQPVILDSLSRTHRPAQGTFVLTQAIGN